MHGTIERLLMWKALVRSSCHRRCDFVGWPKLSESVLATVSTAYAERPRPCRRIAPSLKTPSNTGMATVLMVR
jgi:hypothetical protein